MRYWIIMLMLTAVSFPAYSEEPKTAEDYLKLLSSKNITFSKHDYGKIANAPGVDMGPIAIRAKNNQSNKPLLSIRVAALPNIDPLTNVVINLSEILNQNGQNILLKTGNKSLLNNSFTDGAYYFHQPFTVKENEHLKKIKGSVTYSLPLEPQRIIFSQYNEINTFKEVTISVEKNMDRDKEVTTITCKNDYKNQCRDVLFLKSGSKIYQTDSATKGEKTFHIVPSLPLNTIQVLVAEEVQKVYPFEVNIP